MSDLPNFIECAARAAGVTWESYLAALPAAGYTEEDIRLIRRLGAPDASRPSGKRGRSVKWSDDLNRRLVEEVDAMGDKHGISNACRILAKREPWSSLAAPTSSKRQLWQVLREQYVRLGFAGITVYFDPSTTDPNDGRLGEVIFTIPRKKRRHSKHD